jgi:hypothetical protein
MTGAKDLTPESKETGKVDAKKRKVFENSKGRTYVKGDGGKRVYVKKLFTPKASPKPVLKNAPKEALPRTTTLTPGSKETGKVDAKKRKVFENSKGRTYVRGDGGKRVYVKKLFTPKSPMPVLKNAPKEALPPATTLTPGSKETGKVDAKKRKVFENSKGRTYVKGDGGKRVYVKKLFTPATTLTPGTRGAGNKENESVKRIAMAWKKKVNDRMKPMRKKNYTRNTFDMIAPKLHINSATGFKNKKYTNFPFPVNTARGNRINSGAVIAPREKNFRQVDYLADQVDYLRALSLHDLLTVMSYTNHSHFWLGPFQRSGTVFSNLPSEQKSGMVLPMWSQFDTIVSAGYDVMNPKAPEMLRSSAETYTSLDIGEKYWFYTFLVVEKYISKDTYKLMLQMYVNDLTRIIMAAPTSKEAITVYRGTSTDVYKQVKGRVFKSTQFTSTAYLPKQAMRYAGKRGILARITIPPGQPSLFIAPVNKFGQHGEYEIVLPPCSFEILGRAKKTQVFSGDKFEIARVTDLKMLPVVKKNV